MLRGFRRAVAARRAGLVPLRVEYGGADGLYVYRLRHLHAGEPIRSVPVDGAVVLDYDADGALVGVEILAADEPDR